jgi:hypothetical protein
MHRCFFDSTVLAALPGLRLQYKTRRSSRILLALSEFETEPQRPNAKTRILPIAHESLPPTIAPKSTAAVRNTKPGADLYLEHGRTIGIFVGESRAIK